MKIAYVCPYWDPAICGVKQTVKELATRMQKKGHEVHVFTSDWDKEKRVKKKEEIVNGVHIHRCFHIIRLVNFVSIWPSVFQKLLKENFDVIHSHLAAHPHTFFAALAAKIKHIPHIHTTHCPWSDAERSMLGKILLLPNYHTFNKWIFRNAHTIIAITPWEEKYIQKYGGKKIKIIRNGMSDVFFKKIKRPTFRTEHNISNDKILALFFGRLNSTKSPEILAEVGKEIGKERKDIHFVFVGPDEGKKEEVKKIIEGQQHMQIMDPIKEREKIVDMYQSADIYVLPSYREGLPLTLFEAMASGLPIIATPVNGIPYEIQNKVNGILVPWRNKEQLKEAILKLADHKALRKKFGNTNKKTASKYNWDEIVRETEELYKEAIKK